MEIIVRKPTQSEIEFMQKQPIWEKEISTFPYSYDQQEMCLILEGDVEVTHKDGSAKFGPGDLVIFPEGLSCNWNIKKAVRKHYKFG